MPYEWSPAPPLTDRRRWRLSLWPYRSLLRKDFVIFIGATAMLAVLPLVALLGSPVLWALLPFLGLALWAIWTALEVSYRRGEILEEMEVDETHVRLVHQARGADARRWEANRYWASVHLHPTGGPVEDYITLRGGDREVEIGAFLAVEERRRLYAELKAALVPPDAAMAEDVSRDDP